MHIIKNQETSLLHPWILDELSLPEPQVRGCKGDDVRRVQEWLTLNRFGTQIDGDFGPATEYAVRLFQESRALATTGEVDAETYDAMVLPMRAVLAPPAVPNLSLGETLSLVAKSHLAQHPREVGMENGGPWVRLYMKGRHGARYRWCAGFVTFCLEQATQLLGMEMPIAGSVSCDQLVAQAKRSDCFVPHDHDSSQSLELGGLFLNRSRSNPRDWTHVGIIVEVTSGRVFRTVEGNTNDEGSSNGHEVCGRWRAYSPYRDYIIF